MTMMMPVTLLLIAWPTLIISALFGVGQIVAGGALARRFAQARDWRRTGRVISLLAGVWLLVSGAAETLVAAAEVAHGGLGGPVDALRRQADAVVLGVTALLLLALTVYPLVRRRLR
jgi:hypothetical protein